MPFRQRPRRGVLRIALSLLLSCASVSASKVCTTNSVGQQVCRQKLSGGAVAAIIIVVLLVLGVLVAAFFFVRRRRLQRLDTPFHIDDRQIAGPPITPTRVGPEMVTTYSAPLLGTKAPGGRNVGSTRNVFRDVATTAGHDRFGGMASRFKSIEPGTAGTWAASSPTPGVGRGSGMPATDNPYANSTQDRMYPKTAGYTNRGEYPLPSRPQPRQLQNTRTRPRGLSHTAAYAPSVSRQESSASNRMALRTHFSLVSDILTVSGISVRDGYGQIRSAGVGNGSGEFPLPKYPRPLQTAQYLSSQRSPRSHSPERAPSLPRSPELARAHSPEIHPSGSPDLARPKLAGYTQARSPEFMRPPANYAVKESSPLKSSSSSVRAAFQSFVRRIGAPRVRTPPPTYGNGVGNRF
ncbi:hypothetical protein FISHEDRAFT_77038 [Fistulina hepatica ATCC 64428]|uniref:Uncharacterized protein n=1 Tax=Fistulina hepatica ATCC 64428 TaxID=1128425 RepID=A0A0D7A2Q6_9AGAR|nr:hypothetical protein FISHEDRAFT_77038 [Fistulina hepatica ATCC 64428]